MNFKKGVGAFFSIAVKELKVQARYPINMVAWFLYLLIFGAMLVTAGMMFSGTSDLKMMQIPLCGLIFLTFLESSLWDVGQSLNWERYGGTLESLYLTPVNRFISIIARSVLSLTIGVGITTICLSIICYLHPVPAHRLAIALGILALNVMMFSGLGCVMAGICLLLKDTANLVVNIIWFACMIFCALFFSFSALPAPILWVSRAIPLSYGVDAFRSVLLDSAPELLPLPLEILIVAGSSIGMPILGFLIYRATERVVKIRGGLRTY